MSLGIICDAVLLNPITGFRRFEVVSGELCHGFELSEYGVLGQIHYEQFTRLIKEQFYLIV